MRLALAFMLSLIGLPCLAAELIVPVRAGAIAHALESAIPGDTLLLSADVIIQGLNVVGSGSDHSEINAGIKLTRDAHRSVVRDNLLTGNLYGIDVHGAEDALVQRNRIEGRLDQRMNDRGNGIYVWNAPGLVVEGNDVRFGRDGLFFNSSKKNTFRNNRFRDLRFAVHYMYVNQSSVVDNLSIGNHVGYAIMFSSRVEVTGNVSSGDRDHGIMFNYANHSDIRKNVVLDGGDRCAFLYNSNRNEFSGNHFQNCAIGIHFTAGSQNNEIVGNAFVGNQTQVKYIDTRWAEWSSDGRGNYWSDLAAFDLNADGVADAPYRPNDAMDHVLWSQPSAKLLLGSPAVSLVRWSQSSFPALLPGGVVDSHPLMQPPGWTAPAFAGGFVD